MFNMRKAAGDSNVYRLSIVYDVLENKYKLLGYH